MDGKLRSHPALRPVWVVCGLVSLAVGIVGIFLPLVPTTPLVLLAAFCFTNSSPRLRRWLETHPRFGPMILDWEETGAIPRHIKKLTVATMAAMFVVSLVIGLPLRLLAIQLALYVIGATYVLTRPDGKPR